MKVLIFGASGMVGQGVLRECLLDPGVESVLSLVRSPTGRIHPKLCEIVHRDFLDYAGLEEELKGVDACFFCLGISSNGLPEAEYTRITHDVALAAAEALLRQSPQAAFIFVSGAGTDGTGQSRLLWARVKGRTETDLMRLPFRAVYAFRPAYIQPMFGETSRTRLYRVFYRMGGFLLPILRVLFPGKVTTTVRMGQAMLRVAREGAGTRVLETRDINALGAEGA